MSPSLATLDIWWLPSTVTSSKADAELRRLMIEIEQILLWWIIDNNNNKTENLFFEALLKSSPRHRMRFWPKTCVNTKKRAPTDKSFRFNRWKSTRATKKDDTVVENSQKVSLFKIKKIAPSMDQICQT